MKQTLRYFWHWLTGSPATLYVRFVDKDGLRGAHRQPESYERLSEKGILQADLWRGRKLSDERAVALARALYKKDGFYSDATNMAYEVDHELLDPGDVPVGGTITKVLIKCRLSASQLNDLES